MTLENLRKFFAAEFPQSTVVLESLEAGTVARASLTYSIPPRGKS